MGVLGKLQVHVNSEYYGDEVAMIDNENSFRSAARFRRKFAIRVYSFGFRATQSLPE